MFLRGLCGKGFGGWLPLCYVCALGVFSFVIGFLCGLRVLCGEQVLVVALIEESLRNPGIAIDATIPQKWPIAADVF